MNSRTNNLKIAIDGGAATGKSTISKLLANKLGIKYINTGQMYRLFTLIAIKKNILDDEDKIFELIKDINLYYKEDGNIFSDDFKFEFNDLYSQDVSKQTSKISVYPKVREIAKIKQMKIAQEENKILMEGRDIATVIMKDADYKFFIKVNDDVAAKRRYKQHKEQGEDVSFENIFKDISIRNRNDQNRKIAPLKTVEDSIIIDTSNLTIEQVVNLILEKINV